jgi:hypothetical protein
MRTHSILLVSAMLAACDSSTSTLTPGTNYPEGAVRPRGYFAHPRPPQGYASANAWLQVATLTSAGGPGTVTVDYLRLYARVNGADIPLMADEYNSLTCGTDFARSPWGSDEALGRTFPVSSGVVVFDPSVRPNRVIHPYGCVYPRLQIPAGTDRVWMEASVWVTGVAAVQGGFDYFATPTAKPLAEAGATDWFLAREGWQLISLGKP